MVVPGSVRIVIGIRLVAPGFYDFETVEAAVSGNIGEDAADAKRD